MRRVWHSPEGASLGDYGLKPALRTDGLKPALRAGRGMTLVELILVMALIAVVMGFSAPALSRFIRGRDIGEETRRFLAMTRYARSEAASRSAQLQLWIEPETGRYGLAVLGQTLPEGGKPLEFQLANGLQFDLDPKAADKTGRITILFWPDGSIDENSLESFGIIQTNDNNQRIEIARDAVGTGYFVREPETNG